MSWIRLDTDFPTNDEIRYVTAVTRYAVICVMLYVKAYGSCGIVKTTPSQIAAAMQITEESVIEALRLSMFNCGNKMIEVVHWQRFQRDTTGAERQRKYREKEKAGNGSNALRPLRNTSNADMTVHDSTIQNNTDNTEKSARAKKFEKPTSQEVTTYADSIGYELDGEHFCDHYESNGWKVGRNAMKSWKAAVRTWRGKNYDTNGQTTQAGHSQRTEGGGREAMRDKNARRGFEELPYAGKDDDLTYHGK